MAFVEVVNHKGEIQELLLDIYIPAGHMDDFVISTARFRNDLF
jgi:hypothetical protein